jgi:DNA primase
VESFVPNLNRPPIRTKPGSVPLCRFCTNEPYQCQFASSKTTTVFENWNDIKPRVDFGRVAAALLGPAVKREGRRLLWPCPYHDDRNPSFAVDPQSGTWKCWPCNLGGDAPKLILKLKRMTFPEAIRLVTELAGIVTTSEPSASPAPRPATGLIVSKPAKAAIRPPERLSGLPLADALSLVHNAAGRLWEPEGAKALAYLHDHGLTDETIRAARLGVVRSVSIPTREVDRCYSAQGVVIPWFDGDRLSLVKIRQPKGRQPKYAEAFRYRPGIFPDPAVIEPGHPLIITEGEIDCLLLAQEPRDLAAVVTLGSASSNPDSGILMELMPATPWFVALDGDEAGDESASCWPARADRVRPPGSFKDWTEAVQGRVNLRR